MNAVDDAVRSPELQEIERELAELRKRLETLNQRRVLLESTQEVAEGQRLLAAMGQELARNGFTPAFGCMAEELLILKTRYSQKGRGVSSR